MLRPDQRGRVPCQLTGILAGLAFTSIVLILQSSTLSGRGAEAGLLSFSSALISLLIAAFLYGTAAGEERLAGRLAIMVFLAGAASTVAVLELFYGLTWLVRAGGFPGDSPDHLRLPGHHGPQPHQHHHRPGRG